MNRNLLYKSIVLLFSAFILAGPTIVAQCVPYYSDGPYYDLFIDGIGINGTIISSNGYTSGISYDPNSGIGPINMNVGQSYTLTVYGSGYDYEIFGVWLDYDQDGYFDSSEQVGEAAAYQGEASFTIPIPQGTAPGVTALRIVSQYDYSSGLDPCGSYSYGETEDYEIYIIQQSITPQGCIRYSLGPDSQDYIDGIDINGLNTYGNGFTSGVFYVDNTSLSATLEQGQNYTLTIHGSGYDNEIFGAWIDLNQNGVFESSELIVEAPSSGGSMSISFTVPSTLLGPTLLRVISQEDYTTGLDACGTYSYGEAEDYLMNVVASGGVSQACITYSIGPDSQNYVDGIDLNGLNTYGNGFTSGVFYVDNTSLSTTLQQGQTYTLGIQGSGSTLEFFGAWIDLDQNGSFDSGELIGEVASSAGGITFTVPANALLGSTTLRVISQEDYSSGLDPCGVYTYGEAEDYTVDIVVSGVVSQACITYSIGPDPQDYIDGIDLNGLNTYGNGFTSGVFYVDNTSFSTTLEQGKTYTLGIQGSGSNFEFFGAWIDLDQSGSFDSSEQIGEATASAGGITFTVPANAPIGATLLRVISQEDNSSGLDPCGVFTYGEAEDYTVDIVAPTVTPQACISYSPGSDAQDYIDGIDLNGLNTFGNGFVAGTFYVDNTSFSTTLEQGKNYTLTIYGSGSDFETFGAWIDFDNNGTYDNAELIVEAPSSVGQMSINFTVPTNTIIGPTTLRVISQENYSSGLDPCGSYSYGEAEDYTVNFVSPASGGCTPQYTTGPDGAFYIDGIELIGDTGSTINSYGNGYQNGVNYVDYTQDYETTLSIGYAYTLNIKGSGSDAEAFAAWIDMNQDGIYDPSELIADQYYSVSSYATMTLTLPAGTPTGYTTLRILAQSDGVLSGPCSPLNLTDGTSYDKGEVEDYLVNITEFFLPSSCGIQFSYGANDNVFIDGISLNGISTMSNSFDPQNPYVDLTNDTIPLTKGSQYTLVVGGSVNALQSGVVYGAWIDYDNDGTFNSTNEKIGEAAADQDGYGVIYFTVPAGANTGDIACRVIAQYDMTSGLDACGVYSVGESEDYTITIKGSTNGTTQNSVTIMNECGGSTIVSVTPFPDKDQDGLDDDLEQLLIENFVPKMIWYNGDGCPGPDPNDPTNLSQPSIVITRINFYPSQYTDPNTAPSLYSVANPFFALGQLQPGYIFRAPVIVIQGALLYAKDCGASGHIADSEPFMVSLKYLGGTEEGWHYDKNMNQWQGIEIQTVSHQGTACQQTKIGKYKNPSSTATNEYDKILHSKSKHGSYLSGTTCNFSFICDGLAGCSGNENQYNVNILNAGEPDNPLISDLGLFFSAYAGEDPWNTTTNFLNGGAGKLRSKLENPLTSKLVERATNPGLTPLTSNKICQLYQACSIACITSIETNSTQPYVKLYPNPTGNSTTISLNLDKDDHIVIHVLDLQGKEVQRMENNLTKGKQRIALDTSDFINGIYFVQISSDTKSSITKLVVMH